MPIVGLTRREDVTPRFTRLGKLKKGRMENGKPVDLDYFRFVGEGVQKAEIERVFFNAYGGEPREITVFLPYKTMEENWLTWYEEWGKSGLIHRCNGETLVQWINADKTYTRDYRMDANEPCPYHSGEKQRDPGCTPIGRLSVVIPEMIEAGFIGYITLELHSINDLANLTASLLDAESKSEAGRSPNGLQGIEFKLRRQPEQIGVRYKNRNGQTIKTKSEKWMVRIDPARQWVQHQLEVSQQIALGNAPSQNALPAPVDFVEVEEIDATFTEAPAEVAEEEPPTESTPDPPPQPFQSPAAAIAWAIAQGAFDNQPHAKNAYEKCKRTGNPKDAYEMAALWRADVDKRVGEASYAKEVEARGTADVSLDDFLKTATAPQKRAHAALVWEQLKKAGLAMNPISGYEDKNIDEWLVTAEAALEEYERIPF